MNLPAGRTPSEHSAYFDRVCFALRAARNEADVATPRYQELSDAWRLAHEMRYEPTVPMDMDCVREIRARMGGR